MLHYALKASVVYSLTNTHKRVKALSKKSVFHCELKMSLKPWDKPYFLLFILQEFIYLKCQIVPITSLTWQPH